MPGLPEQFLEYLRDARNYSPNTVATYRRTYATFPDIATADRARVEQWWSARGHNAPATRRNELAAVRSFYAWCRRFEHRPPADDPTHRIDTPKQGQRLPHPMSRADMRRILTDAPDDLRRAICLGGYAGLRVAEAAGLHWSNIDLETNRIMVRGKGDKDRAVAIGPLLIDNLLPNTGGNVVTGISHQISPNALQVRVNRWIKSCGVAGTFHHLRHRYGTVALGSTSNLLLVSRAMGHSSPATTAIYAATADSDLDIIAAAVEQ